MNRIHFISLHLSVERHRVLHICLWVCTSLRKRNLRNDSHKASILTCQCFTVCFMTADSLSFFSMEIFTVHFRSLLIANSSSIFVVPSLVVSMQ